MLTPKTLKFALFLFVFAQSALASQIDSLKYPDRWITNQLNLAQDILSKGLEVHEAQNIFKNIQDFALANDLLDKYPEAVIGYGIAQYKNGDVEDSYNTLSEILPTLNENQKSLKAEVQQVLGMNLVFQDQFSKGYKHQMDALKYYIDVQDSMGMMKLYFDLGGNFGTQEQYELALVQYEKGMEIAQRVNDQKTIMLGTTALSGLWASLKDYDKALEYSSQSMDLATKLDDQEELAWAALNRGYILSELSKFKEAEKFLKTAHELSYVLRNKMLTAYALEQLSNVYINQKRLLKATEALNGSFEIYKEIGQTYSLKNVYKKYAEIYYLEKNFEKYKQYTDQYMALKDSLHSKEMIESMASLRQDYELHKMEKENEFALLKKDQQLSKAQKNISAALTFGTIVILVLLLSLLYIRNKSAADKHQILMDKNAEISRQIEILASSNKDLEKFAYIISHDLKEPLRNINGFTKLLTRCLRDVENEEVKEYAGFIVNSTEQMDELLSGLLEYSKLNANKADKSMISLDDCLFQVVSGLTIQMKEKNCRLESEDLPDIFYRKTHIKQVLQNLIANAVKFSPQEGNLIKVSCTEFDDKYEICVADKGIGIDPKFQKDIFVVFQRLHDRGTYSGSGIGLATCKKIVENHGGNIRVESTLGEGAKFFFTIPKNTKTDIIEKISQIQNADAEESLLLSMNN